MAAIDARKVGPVVVLHVRGALTIHERSQALEHAIRAALDGGARAFVINLQDVSAVDSSGVAQLATTHNAVFTHRGRLALCHLSAKLTEIFVITRLNTVFDTYETEAEAVAAVTERRS
jgi:anti-sigma B factor antagonist